MKPPGLGGGGGHRDVGQAQRNGNHAARVHGDVDTQDLTISIAAGFFFCFVFNGNVTG